MRAQRDNQVKKIYQLYPQTQSMGYNMEFEDVRIPLFLSKATQPLYVKVSIPWDLLNKAPTIWVMHRVVHEKIDPQTFAYKNESLKNWSPHSQLSEILRKMHQEFELNPPLPEGHQQLAAKSNQVQKQESEVISVQEDVSQEKADQVEAKEPEEVKPMRSEQER